MGQAQASEDAVHGGKWKVIHADGGMLRSGAALASATVRVLPTGTEVRELEQEVVEARGHKHTRVRIEGGGAAGWLTKTLPSGIDVIEKLPSEPV
jgi:hypothetical protein